MLAPALRIFPAETAAIAGRSTWLCPLAASPLLIGYMHFLTKLMGCRQDGENFQDMTLRALGDKAGKLALVLMSLWMLIYSGFVLRAGADRFIAAVYPSSSPTLFILILAALGLMAGWGRLKVLSRCAEVVQPLLIFSLIVSAGLLFAPKVCTKVFGIVVFLIVQSTLLQMRISTAATSDTDARVQ
jgi:hypothetical protein